jgi:hypothetical protein
MNEQRQNRSTARLRDLQRRLARYRALERRHRTLVKQLREKEEFNFALFQYSPITTVVVDRQGKVVKTNLAKRSSGDRIPDIGDIMYRDYAAGHEIDMYGELMSCMTTGTTRMYAELRYGSKVLCITIAPFPAGAIITSIDITATKQAEEDRIKLIGELKRALDEVERLRGLLPICAACKKIRDDEGYWSQIEEYLDRHTDLTFSHTVCPECARRLYPEVADEIYNDDQGAAE